MKILTYIVAVVMLTGGCSKSVDLSIEQQMKAQGSSAPTVLTNSIGMKLVLVPAGEFVMGSSVSEEGQETNEEQHQVRITEPFYIGICEVTVGQFRQFVEAKDYQTLAEQRGGQSTFTWRRTGFAHQTDENPVTNMFWNDTAAFCQWLGQKEGRRYRLPTEAEWEYACRAGSTTRYTYGESDSLLGNHAWYAENSNTSTHPVGGKLPNSWGLYDMHGNVWEWCTDWYGDDYYEHSPVVDPTGPATGAIHVFRGGGWKSNSVNCRSAMRPFKGAVDLDSIGFRVVLERNGNLRN